jgi:flagellar basal-body rod protein FlgC
MSLFGALDISASGLTAERLRMNVTAENLANAQTTRGTDGGPYKRKLVVLEEAGGSTARPSFGTQLDGAMNGVKVAQVSQDSAPDRLVYDPSHPDADARGYVHMPNVNPVTEMVDLISASRSYEANVTAMQTAKQLYSKTLDILR